MEIDPLLPPSLSIGLLRTPRGQGGGPAPIFADCSRTIGAALQRVHDLNPRPGGGACHPRRWHGNHTVAPQSPADNAVVRLFCRSNGIYNQQDFQEDLECVSIFGSIFLFQNWPVKAVMTIFTCLFVPLPGVQKLRCVISLFFSHCWFVFPSHHNSPHHIVVPSGCQCIPAYLQRSCSATILHPPFEYTHWPESDPLPGHIGANPPVDPRAIC